MNKLIKQLFYSTLCKRHFQCQNNNFICDKRNENLENLWVEICCNFQFSLQIFLNFQINVNSHEKEKIDCLALEIYFEILIKNECRSKVLTTTEEKKPAKKNDQRQIIKNDDIKIYFNFPENFKVFIAFIKKLFLAAVCLCFAYLSRACNQMDDGLE